MATYDKLIDLERLQAFKDGCDSEYQQTLVSGTNIKTVNSQSLLGSGNIAISSDVTTWYGTCSTAGSERIKEVSCDGFTLKKGAVLLVYFDTQNTYTGDSSTALNVNSTGSKTITMGQAANSKNLLWAARTHVLFVYDGSKWVYLVSSAGPNVNLVEGAGVYYGFCNTPAYDADKRSGGPQWSERVNGLVVVSMSNGNTVTDRKLTLSVNSMGSKDIYANGAATSSTNTLLWNAGDVLFFMWSISRWDYLGGSTAYGYTLPTASTSTLGGVKVDGSTITIDGNGVISGSSNVSPYTGNPAMDGTASAGSSDDYARGDHIHPTDTSRQAALISGTNIKTVNSTSLLGSGNVAVQPTLVSGTNIKTVNNESLLGSGNVSISFDETSTEIPLDTTSMSTESASYFEGWNDDGADNVSLGLNALYDLAQTKASSSHTHSGSDITSGTVGFSYLPTGSGSNQVAIGNHSHSGYQATLVSGTNIKTVGSQSLLGSGNLTVSDIGAAPTSHTHQYAGSPAAGGNANKANAILYGAVDSTSTSTAFTATVAGLTQLVDGTTIMLRNGVVTSASGFTLEVNDLGALPVYNNMATGNSITPTAPARDTTIFNINYTMLFTYVASDIVEGGCWICWRGYDGNTNTIGYQLRTNSSTLKASDTGYKYRLWFTSADRTKWVPANTSTSTSATAAKTMNTRPIDPFGPIVYNSTNGTVTADADVPKATIWTVYTLDARYSYMKSGFSLTYPAPVFVKCTPQSNGSAVMSELVQAFPNSNDGKIYIFLGIAYSASSMELRPEHPVYYHDGTAVRLWTGAAASSVSPATATPSMDGTAAVGSSAKYAREDHVHPTDTSRVAASATSGTQTTTVDNFGSVVRLTSTNGNKYADIQIGRSGQASASMYANQGTAEATVAVTPTSAEMTVDTSVISVTNTGVSLTGDQFSMVSADTMEMTAVSDLSITSVESTVTISAVDTIDLLSDTGISASSLGDVTISSSSAIILDGNNYTISNPSAFLAALGLTSTSGVSF